MMMTDCIVCDKDATRRELGNHGGMYVIVSITRRIKKAKPDIV